MSALLLDFLSNDSILSIAFQARFISLTSSTNIALKILKLGENTVNKSPCSYTQEAAHPLGSLLMESTVASIL
jgi:hypothetical protein